MLKVPEKRRRSPAKAASPKSSRAPSNTQSVSPRDASPKLDMDNQPMTDADEEMILSAMRKAMAH